MRELVAYVRAATEVFRHGERVTEAKVDGIYTITIDDFPPLPATDRVLINMHFFSVGFTEAAPSWSHRKFYDTILANWHGEFTNLHQQDWEGGPSYITIGSWIGSQTLAMQLMALGQLHEIWQVVTPERLGFTGDAADRMAGNGLVLTAGFKEPEMADA